MLDDGAMLIELLSRLSTTLIQDRIAFIKQADLNRVEIEELKAALDEMLRAYGSYSKSIRQGEPIFRAMRHCPNEGLFENVSRIYPDPARITRLGRANREHQAIYYLCGEPVISFHEIKVKQDDVVTILKCGPRNGQSPRVVPIGIDQMLEKLGVKAGGDFPDNSVRIQDLLKHNPDALKKYCIIDEFITTEFLKDIAEGQEHQYKTTVAIAEFLFSFSTEDAPIDGLAYPSIAGEQKHANLALSPTAFHRIYQPGACERGKIANLLTDLGLSFDPKEAVIAIGIDSDGRIRWPTSR
jgi:hypothetical protein